MQHAIDLLNFKDVKLVAPRNGNGNEFYKEDAGSFVEGDNFYRIKATNAGGKITFSSVTKLLMPQVLQGMNVYPNPSASRQLQLQTGAAPQGKYQVRPIGINGTIYQLGTMQLKGIQSLQPITLPANIKPGLYRIQLIGNYNKMIVKSVTIL